METIEVSDEIRKNFHLFWDNFPAPVMLVHKSRTIIETNKAGRGAGLAVGTRCVDMGEKKHHAGCRANVALRDHKAVREVAYYDFLGMVLDAYWIPLEGAEDLYIHFSNDITEYAADRMIPKKCGENTACGCNC